MDRLGTMETFVRVVETRSFSAAARDLKIGQPAVSKSIAHLEERFGVRLLMRSTRGLTPTEAGQDFYERARKIIDEARDADIADDLAGGLEFEPGTKLPIQPARLEKGAVVRYRSQVAGQQQQVASRNLRQLSVHVAHGGDLHVATLANQEGFCFALSVAAV